ncbi:hypothetical protein EG68_07108 [Paragonimus skrjabini miyazakii]|uniref:Uncharacterized protein n=1 Tax=Paragonimus skrjabini miyazakii TaxID=59628 RepID=A0A8S9YKT4_9TREM|nr:hypothetical protein EG68_07108 [Paragonimus skrjabini miyazakii]
MAASQEASLKQAASASAAAERMLNTSGEDDVSSIGNCLGLIFTGHLKLLYCMVDKGIIAIVMGLVLQRSKAELLNGDQFFLRLVPGIKFLVVIVACQ